MKPIENKYIRFRIVFIGIVFTIFFMAIGAKAVYLQVFRGSWLSEKAASQYERAVITKGKRGTIYDTKLNKMAVSLDITSIAAHPQRLNDSEKVAADLSRVLHINRHSVLRKLISKKKFVWIKRKVTPDEARAVKALNIKGITFLPEHNRYYPNKALAAQLLGFAGMDSHGLEGLEFYYDSYLEGHTDLLTVSKDALGRGFAFDVEKKKLSNSDGNNLILTIDRSIQYIAEEALEKAVKEYSAKSGIAIVMEPKTGALLALAHFPFFNPNTYSKYGKNGVALWRNRALTDPFEPGSTMKIFTAAAAIESGVSSADALFYCENGSYRIGKDIVHDTHPRAWLTLNGIIKYSSNIGIIKVGEKIGPETLYRTLTDFGFGQKTWIDCPGETSGTLSSYKKWSDIDAGTIAFGQGISVSTIQLVSAASAIANQGILMKPYVVQAITDPNGRLVKSFGPKKIRRIISAKTAETIIAMMKLVLEDKGTGVNAALDGYSAGGKTGTAQKINENGEYAKGKYVSSFLGFAPAENPETVILVVIDEPEGKYYGGTVAGPVFKNIAQGTLYYMGISPRSMSDRLALPKRIGDRA